MTRIGWLSVGLAAWICAAAKAAPLPMELKRPAGVHVVGVYEGTCPDGARLRGGLQPQGTVRVAVADFDRPIILVLVAYEPVLWKVKAPRGAIARVIASGYHEQEVAGLEDNVPVTRISYVKDKEGYFYAYRKDAADNEHATDRSYQHLVQRVKELTNLEIASFQGAYAGESFEVK